MDCQCYIFGRKSNEQGPERVIQLLWRHRILYKAFILGISFLPFKWLAAQSHTVPSSDGIPITYEVRGKGSPTLVFVHGWSCDRTYWKGQIEPFSKIYQVVAIDLAGHGESGKGRKKLYD
jgi:hypothetical protein